MSQPNVINNIPNTKYEVVEGSSLEGWIFRITPINGAKIVTDPAPTYTVDSYGDGQTQTLEFDNVSEDEVSNHWNIFAYGDSPIIFNGQTTGGTGPTVTVLNNITGEKPTESHKIDGNNVTITLTADSSGYYFFGVKAAYTGTDGSEKTVEFPIKNQTVSITLNDVDLTKPITLTGVCDTGISVTNNLVNCTAEGLKAAYQKDEVMQVVLTAKDGFVFKKDTTPPTVNGLGSFGQIEQQFDFTDGETTASIMLDMSTVVEQHLNSLTLDGGAVASIPPTPTGSRYGAINVYVVTSDDLNTIATERFYESTDRTNYVNRIKRIYAVVPTSGEDKVQLGDYTSSVSGKLPTKQVIECDFGTITLPAHNENTTDYDGAFSMFIPFRGFVDIPSEYAGKEISLVCLTDIITGSGIAKLACDGIMFATYEIEPSEDVLFRTVTQQVNQIGGNNWNNQLLAGVEPFVVCKWYESRDATSESTQKVVKIGDCRGYNVFSDVDPITTPTMLADEQRSIYTALKDGVYIE